MNEEAGFTDGVGVDVRPLDLAAKEHTSAEAQTAMEAVAVAFVRGARRSLPFLVKFKGRVVPRPVAIAARDESVEGLSDLPMYTVALGGAANAWATLTLSAQAIAMVLEGSMGGRGAASPAQMAPQLTVAQRALVARIARSLGKDFATAVKDVGQLELDVAPDDARKEQGQSAKALAGLRIVCDVEGFGAGGAAIILTLGAEAWNDAIREASVHTIVQGDSGISAALPEVPLEIIAELGRISLGLGRVLSLKAGDVIRLPTAVDDAISLRIAGMEKFLAVPITSRGQLAVEIRARHEK
jgi:flagellar motor switch protein FliM